jgi:hypothetical protein
LQFLKPTRLKCGTEIEITLKEYITMSVKSDQIHVVSEREVPFSVRPDANVNPGPGMTTLYQRTIDQLAMILCSWAVGGTTALTITARGAATRVKMLAPRYRAKKSG